jgi:hypothetical protein
MCFPHSWTNCTEGAVRLVDGETPLDGRYEVCVNGIWKTDPPPRVDYYYGYYLSTELEKAERICRQLGFPWECELPMHDNIMCVYVEV